MIELTREEAERIAYMWLNEQETVIDLYGGYMGELLVARDLLVWFINCNGHKHDGARVSLRTKYEVLADWDREDLEEVFFENPEGWKNHEAYGESVQAIADYLMTADGGEAEYSAGNSYKENSPATKAWREAN